MRNNAFIGVPMNIDSLEKIELSCFRNRDIVTIKDVAERFGVSEYSAGELIRGWKVLLKRENRDRLDMKGRLTKDDYAFILGVDVRLLY